VWMFGARLTFEDLELSIGVGRDGSEEDVLGRTAVVFQETEWDLTQCSALAARGVNWRNRKMNAHEAVWKTTRKRMAGGYHRFPC
jgi:hypothetical protein